MGHENISNEQQEIAYDVKTPPARLTDEEVASSILSLLSTAEKPGRDLELRVQDLVRTSGWSEGLAKRILDGLVDQLNAASTLAGALKEAFDKAYEVAHQWVLEHPVLTEVLVTIVAIGILAILVPWAVEALGFAELGPVEGMMITPLPPPQLLLIFNLDLFLSEFLLTYHRIFCYLVAINVSRRRSRVAFRISPETRHEVGEEIRMKTLIQLHTTMQ